jgi:UDP-N-acetyl-2-amino-2-deoxyglucuronate dehydrogenase
MKKYGFAVIGCGDISDFHIKAIHEIDQAHLVGVSSRKVERAQEVGEREGCFWTTDSKELLRHPDVDIVCVTTSSGSHGQIGMDVLAEGKHLLIEKPIAMNSVEANQMISLAKEKDVIFSVVSQRRFEEQHQYVKNLLHNKALGKLLLVEIKCPYLRTQEYYNRSPWRGTFAEDGGALMNQAIHSIDLMLWMAGPAKSVMGKVATQTHQMEAEDMGLALVTFENGGFGTIMSSTSIQPGFPPTLSLYGEKGTIIIEGTSITQWMVPDIEKPVFKNDGLTGGGVNDPKSIPTLYHQMQILDVIEAVDKKRKPAITGDDGKISVQLIEAIYQSSINGKEINLGEI